MAYRAADNPDRVKAVAAVLLVHAGLAAVILSGLHVQLVERTVERLKMIDVRVPPPPPPPPPRKTPERAREEEGAAGKIANPSAIVAPEPEIVVPIRPRMAASRVRGTGSASTAGAGSAGTGTGAGGSGAGAGGGDFSRFTPARMINKIPDREYRRISGGRIPQGSATIAFRVETNGRMTGCRVLRTSGDHYVDWIVCQAATANLRFRPAHDASGQPVAQDMTYTPTWRPNR